MFLFYSMLLCVIFTICCKLFPEKKCAVYTLSSATIINPLNVPTVAVRAGFRNVVRCHSILFSCC